MLSINLEENIAKIYEIFPIETSFDIITRNLFFGATKVFWIGINGFCKSDTLQLIFSDLQSPEYTDNSTIDNIDKYLRSKIGYIQSELTDDWDRITGSILSGPSVLFIDGSSQAIILDTRVYPLRGIEEPDTEKITRGAKDGFIESVISNTSLIRRRIRNPKLTFKLYSIGTESRTDVAVGFIQGSASDDIIAEIDKKLNRLDITTLTMGTKSLEELLIKKRWFNTLPSFYVTERPDVACSYITEGHAAIIVDNSPSVILLPCTIFQFTQAPEDYYKGLAVGNYIRIIRFACILISLFALPVFLMSNTEADNTTLFIYILLTEFALDLFKYSSAHASSRFSGSLSLIGGLVLSDVAVELNWTTLEAIFYGAATMLASLSLPNIDFSEGLRLYRLILVILTGLFGKFGFIAGGIIVLISIITTPTFAKRSYFWPLFPLNITALKKLLFRYPTSKAQPIKLHRKSKAVRSDNDSSNN